MQTATHTEQLPLRAIANCVAGADVPYLMNWLHGRQLTAKERAERQAAAVTHLTGKYKWLEEIETLGLEAGSLELAAWVRGQMARLRCTLLHVEQMDESRPLPDDNDEDAPYHQDVPDNVDGIRMRITRGMRNPPYTP